MKQTQGKGKKTPVSAAVEQTAKGSVTFSSDGVSYSVPTAVVKGLEEGMAHVSKGYAFYRNIAVPFVQAFTEECLIAGTIANKNALLFIKRHNAEWSGAVSRIEELARTVHKTKQQEFETDGAVARRDSAARVCANAFQRIRFYYEDWKASQDSEGEKTGNTRQRKSPRQMIENLIPKLEGAEDRKDLAPADKQLARLAIAALRAVLDGSFVPALIPSKATKATVGSEAKQAGPVKVLTGEEAAKAAA
jgi:hypothetical protein